MSKFFLLLLSLNLVAVFTMAQKKTKTTPRQPVVSGISPGKEFTFNDGVYISGLPSATKAILKQKGFKAITTEQESQHKIDTILYTHTSGEKLYFFYDPMYGYIPNVLFQTSSAAKARQMLAEAVKKGFHATDSMAFVTGNEDQSYPGYKVSYGQQIAPTTPPPAYNSFNNFFTTSEGYGPTGKLYFFQFSSEAQNELSVMAPPATGVSPVPLKKNKMPGDDGQAVDTLTFEPGKPVLLFIEMGNSDPYYTSMSGRDSAAFFKKQNFFKSSFHVLEQAYPKTLNRYVNLYKPAIVRYANNKREVLSYLPGGQYSGFVYWSGKTTDRVIKHDTWQEALYVVANATGDNRLRPGYKTFLKDSLLVDLILQHPAYRPSPDMLRQMNHFILSALWEEKIVLLPLLNIEGVRSILISGNNSTHHYYFNQRGQLDSLVSQADDRFFSRSVKGVVYKEGIPVLTYGNSFDSVRLSYDKDTLMLQRKGIVQRYLLNDLFFHMTDNFKTGAVDYFKNNIRDHTHNFYDTDLNPAVEKDTAGNLLVKIRPWFEDIQGKYIFRKGILQQIELSSRSPGISGKYYVFIQRYP